MMHGRARYMGVGMAVLSVLVTGSVAWGAAAASDGDTVRLAAIPPGELRNGLAALSEPLRTQALQALAEHDPEGLDYRSLRVDEQGRLLYVCVFPGAAPASIPRLVAASSGGGGPVEASLAPPALHSRPGCANVLFLDFDGGVIEGRAWGGGARYDCLPCDWDGDGPAFSANEQAVISQLWQRVAEDFAPFDVDVTTEEPAEWTDTTAHAMITYTQDADGTATPLAGVGGIAYVGIFGDGDNAYFSPAWVRADYGWDTAEIASHEVGHNMGLRHDGSWTSGGQWNEYYGGHGSGATKWAPIMGGSYNDNVTQWSKGEYYMANRTEDDLAIMAARFDNEGTGYREDDVPDTLAEAPLLNATHGATLVTNGVIERTSDVDVFAFNAAAGPLSITVMPFRAGAGSRGGNLDVKLSLHDVAGNLVLESDAPDDTDATLSTTLPAGGRFYLEIAGVGSGDPLNNPPTGYTDYGSLGQYFLTGTVSPPDADRELPFRETFEPDTPPMAGTAGPLTGQHGWESVNTEVQAEVARGAQAARLNSLAWAKHRFADERTEVWTDLYIRPTFGVLPETGAVFSDTTVVMCVASNGQVQVYDGTTPRELAHPPLTQGNWVRVTIHSDYVGRTWDLYVDRERVGRDLGFFGPDTATYSEFRVEEGGKTDVEGTGYFDDITIGMSKPSFLARHTLLMID